MSKDQVVKIDKHKKHNPKDPKWANKSHKPDLKGVAIPKNQRKGPKKV